MLLTSLIQNYNNSQSKKTTFNNKMNNYNNLMRKYKVKTLNLVIK